MLKKIKEVSYHNMGDCFSSLYVFTVMVKTVDVQPVGPDHSKVGLASVNQCVFKFFGVNLLWYDITDWLGVFAIVIAFGVCSSGTVPAYKAEKH